MTTPDAPLLAVQDLTVSFATLRGRMRVLDGVGFDVARGEVLGLVGESGSGKSVTALSILGLLGEAGRIDAGRIGFGGRDLLAERDLLGVRGREIAMIFQEPMTSLNPVFSVGFQVARSSSSISASDDGRPARGRSSSSLRWESPTRPERSTSTRTSSRAGCGSGR